MSSTPSSSAKLGRIARPVHLSERVSGDLRGRIASGELKPGDRVNIESDLMIRWLADRFKEGEVASAEDVRAAGWGAFHLED